MAVILLWRIYQIQGRVQRVWIFKETKKQRRNLFFGTLKSTEKINSKHSQMFLKLDVGNIRTKEVWGTQEVY